jgi:hypothetical protein
VGVATPIVSASTISSASSRAQRSATCPGSTRPSKGQPNATLTVAVVGSSDTPRIAIVCVSAWSSDMLPLRRLNDSVAASVQLTRPSVVSRRRS